MSTRRLHVFENSQHRVVAYDRNDAWKLWSDGTGDERREFARADPLRQRRDADEMTLCDQDGGNEETITMREYADERGRGFHGRKEW